MRIRSVSTRPSGAFGVSALSAACLGVLSALFAAGPVRADGLPKLCATTKEYTLSKSTFARKKLILREVRVQGTVQDSLPAEFISVLGVGAVALRDLDTLKLESEEADSLGTGVRAFIAKSARKENSNIHFQAAP